MVLLLVPERTEATMRLFGPAMERQSMQEESVYSAKVRGANRSNLENSLKGTAPDCSSAYVVFAKNHTQSVQLVQERGVAAAIHGVFKRAAGNDQAQQTSTIAITSILQNEPREGLHSCLRDAAIDDVNRFYVLAENPRQYSPMQGHQGRTYFITFTARNSFGSCKGRTTACIPAQGATECSTADGDTLYESTACERLPMMPMIWD